MNMYILVQVNSLREEKNLVKFQSDLRYILAEFVRGGAPSQINISDGMRRKTERKAAAVLLAFDQVSMYEH